MNFDELRREIYERCQSEVGVIGNEVMNETKLKNLARYIVSVSDKTRPKKGTDSSDFGDFEYKEVKINLPLEVIEELREWTK